MTKITIEITKNREFSAIRCEGHAGYSDYGSDIVCSAISILVINTINSIEELTKEEINVITNENSGLIICEFNEHPSKEAVLLIDSMILGLTEIEKQYGKKHLKLTYKEV